MVADCAVSCIERVASETFVDHRLDARFEASGDLESDPEALAIELLFAPARLRHGVRRGLMASEEPDQMLRQPDQHRGLEDAPLRSEKRPAGLRASAIFTLCRQAPAPPP
jgi:hypothetical protein